MKKSWILLLAVPLMLKASDLKFLTHEVEELIDSSKMESLFDEELSKINPELLLQAEKMPIQKPAFPWVDEEVIDETISLFVEQEAKSSKDYLGKSPQSDIESQFHPTFEVVPPRANHFWAKSSPIKTLKPKEKKQAVQEVKSQTKKSMQPTKKQSSAQKEIKLDAMQKRAQAKNAAKKAKKQSPIVKNLNQQQEKKAGKSIGDEKIVKKSPQESPLLETKSSEAPVLKKKQHELPDYLPDWDTE